MNVLAVDNKWYGQKSAYQQSVALRGGNCNSLKFSWASLKICGLFRTSSKTPWAWSDGFIWGFLTVTPFTSKEWWLCLTVHLRLRASQRGQGIIIQETSWLNDEVSSVLPETVWYRQKHKAGTLIWKAKCQTFHRHTSSPAGWRRFFFIILQPLFVCDVWDVRPWKTTYFRPAQMEPLVSTWHNHTTQTADCPLRCKMGSPPVRPEVRHL